MQIYRPCVNIKVFTSFSKDFSQTAYWLVFTILVIIFLYSYFHCIYSVLRTAVPTNTLVSAGGQQQAISWPPALPTKGECCWPGLHKPSSQPASHLLHIAAPCKPATPNLESTAPATALILDILGKGMAKGGKGLF